METPPEEGVPGAGAQRGDSLGQGGAVRLSGRSHKSLLGPGTGSENMRNVCFMRMQFVFSGRHQCIRNFAGTKTKKVAGECRAEEPNIRPLLMDLEALSNAWKCGRSTTQAISPQLSTGFPDLP